MQLTTHSDFKVESLGIQEIEVYDLEVENDHNFVANNILVHNSGYFSLEPVVKKSGITDKEKIVKFLDRFCNEVLAPKIHAYTEEMSDYFNSYENRMMWEREVIAESGIFVAKKRYTMAVNDDEGKVYPIDSPKLKITGLEAKRSDIPKWSKEFLKQAYPIALLGNEEELQTFVKECRKNFDTYSLSHIAIPSGVNGLEKYACRTRIYNKGTPKHVKAALIHNKMVTDMGLNHIELIFSGNKIKYLPLKKANPIGQEVIGFSIYLPEEFKLDKFVDRSIIFEKSFIKPLQSLLDNIGWTTEKINTLF